MDSDPDCASNTFSFFFDIGFLPLLPQLLLRCMMMLIQVTILPLIWTIVDADSDTDLDKDYASDYYIPSDSASLSDSDSEHCSDSESDSDYFTRVWWECAMMGS